MATEQQEAMLKRAEEIASKASRLARSTLASIYVNESKVLSEFMVKTDKEGRAFIVADVMFKNGKVFKDSTFISFSELDLRYEYSFIKNNRKQNEMRSALTAVSDWNSTQARVERKQPKHYRIEL